MWAGQHTDQLGTGTGNLYLSATGGANRLHCGFGESEFTS